MDVFADCLFESAGVLVHRGHSVLPDGLFPRYRIGAPALQIKAVSCSSLSRAGVGAGVS
jgi:hypothetical protein